MFEVKAKLHLETRAKPNPALSYEKENSPCRVSPSDLIESLAEVPDCQAHMLFRDLSDSTQGDAERLLQCSKPLGPFHGPQKVS